MKLVKIVKLLSDLDEKCSKKPDAIRLEVMEVVLKCENEMVITFKDKKVKDKK